MVGLGLIHPGWVIGSWDDSDYSSSTPCAEIQTEKNCPPQAHTKDLAVLLRMWGICVPLGGVGEGASSC